MTLQSAVTTSITYGAESTFGTAPAAGSSAQIIRRISSSLTIQKASFSSNEVRVDQEVNDLRHGERSVRGQIQGELSDGTWDTWLAALLRGTWATDVLVPGVLKPSYTIEQNYPEIDIAEKFVGCRIGQASFRLPPNGMATVDWEVMGQDGEVLTGAAAPYFTAPVAQTSSGGLTGIDGEITVAGVVRGVVTGLDFTVNNNLQATPVIGSVHAPDIFYGTRVVGGSVSMFVESAAILDLFLAETELDIKAKLTSLDTVARTLEFAMHRCKFTGISKTLGAQGGVIAQFGFQALNQSTTGTGSMVITRGDAA